MTGQWVVTYQFELCSEVLVTEFFRGSRAECLRILLHSCRGSDDRRQTGRWMPIISPVESWNEFLDSALDGDKEVVYVGPWR